jgi:hypothetical protein
MSAMVALGAQSSQTRQVSAYDSQQLLVDHIKAVGIAGTGGVHD